MKTLVVCGLLGAGKTTFVRRFARQAAGKTVILVNDFGETGIDGEILGSEGLETVELPSGCVCCTLRFDLITTIEKVIRRFSPDHLVIEPSGVASPSGVLDALESLGIGPVLVAGIVDVTEFPELYESGMYGTFFEDQIVNSDVILLNKTDLASPEVVGKTRRLAESLNPRAVVFETVNAEIRGPLPEAAGRRRAVPGHSTHLRFDAVSIRFGGEISFSNMKGLFDRLSEGVYGEVARAKALVRTERGAFRMDITYGKTDIAAFEGAVAESRLVVIGRGIDEESLRRDASPLKT